jgi:hypothetical protein
MQILFHREAIVMVKLSFRPQFRVAPGGSGRSGTTGQPPTRLASPSTLVGGAKWKR